MGAGIADIGKSSKDEAFNKLASEALEPQDEALLLAAHAGDGAGAPDKDGARAKGQHLEHVGAGAHAAVGKHGQAGDAPGGGAGRGLLDAEIKCGHFLLLTRW